MEEQTRNGRGSLTGDVESWKNNTTVGLTSVMDMTADGLQLLFRIATDMKVLVKTKGGDDRMKGKVLATVFFEASTRTSTSFQAAMCRLGGSFVHVDGGSGGQSSASKKGESLQDTIRCMECYSDILVLRHPIQGSIASVLPGITKPLVNAGDGTGEHPTQALLDLFTIIDELKLFPSTELASSPQSTQPLIILLLGDLKHGRTVHSLAKLLARVGPALFPHRSIVLRYCSPSSLPMPTYVQDFVQQQQHHQSSGNTVVQETYENLQDAIQGVHVLYVTRIQKERFERLEDYHQVKGQYVVDRNLLNANTDNPNMIVLHPLPRVDEISTEIDSDPRAAYFRQMENGMYVRMAILALLLGHT